MREDGLRGIYYEGLVAVLGNTLSSNTRCAFSTCFNDRRSPHITF